MRVKTTTLLFLVLALGSPAAASAALPVHPGHPILPVSAKEAKRERAMTKSFTLRIAKPAPNLRAQIYPYLP